MSISMAVWYAWSQHHFPWDAQPANCYCANRAQISVWNRCDDVQRSALKMASGNSCRKSLLISSWTARTIRDVKRRYSRRHLTITCGAAVSSQRSIVMSSLRMNWRNSTSVRVGTHCHSSGMTVSISCLGVTVRNVIHGTSADQCVILARKPSVAAAAIQRDSLLGNVRAITSFWFEIGDYGASHATSAPIM